MAVLGGLARTHGVTMALGLKDRGRNLNIQRIFGPDGRILGEYHKNHLVTQHEGSTPGTTPPAVVDTEFGALGTMIPLFRLFAGGPLGSGRQWFPWIHMDDLISAVLFVFNTPALDGPVNFCSPVPTRQREFANALGKALTSMAAIKWLEDVTFDLLIHAGTIVLYGHHDVGAEQLDVAFDPVAEQVRSDVVI